MYIKLIKYGYSICPIKHETNPVRAKLARSPSEDEDTIVKLASTPPPNADNIDLINNSLLFFCFITSVSGKSILSYI